MSKTRNTMILLVAVLALVVVSALPAQMPKAKTAAGSVRVEVPQAMIDYFESRGVDLSEIALGKAMPAETAAAVNAVYNAEDSLGDRVHGPRINGIASLAMQAAYREVGRPVYLQLGPLYWGHWTDKDGLSESDQ